MNRVAAYGAAAALALVFGGALGLIFGTGALGIARYLLSLSPESSRTVGLVVGVVVTILVPVLFLTGAGDRFSVLVFELIIFGGPLGILVGLMVWALAEVSFDVSAEGARYLGSVVAVVATVAGTAGLHWITARLDGDDGPDPDDGGD